MHYGMNAWTVVGWFTFSLVVNYFLIRPKMYSTLAIVFPIAVAGLHFIFKVDWQGAIVRMGFYCIAGLIIVAINKRHYTR